MFESKLCENYQEYLYLSQMRTPIVAVHKIPTAVDSSVGAGDLNLEGIGYFRNQRKIRGKQKVNKQKSYQDMILTWKNWVTMTF